MVEFRFSGFWFLVFAYAAYQYHEIVSLGRVDDGDEVILFHVPLFHSFHFVCTSCFAAASATAAPAAAANFVLIIHPSVYFWFFFLLVLQFYYRLKHSIYARVLVFA